MIRVIFCCGSLFEFLDYKRKKPILCITLAIFFLHLCAFITVIGDSGPLNKIKFRYFTMYVIPSSVPASHGNKSMVISPAHEQFGRQRSSPDTPEKKKKLRPNGAN